MFVLNSLSVRAGVLVVIDLAVLGRVLFGIRVERRYLSHCVLRTDTIHPPRKEEGLRPDRRGRRSPGRGAGSPWSPRNRRNPMEAHMPAMSTRLIAEVLEDGVVSSQLGLASKGQVRS